MSKKKKMALELFGDYGETPTSSKYDISMLNFAEVEVQRLTNNATRPRAKFMAAYQGPRMHLKL